MEPLRLDLSEDVALMVQNTSPRIKDDIEAMHNKLIMQVRQYYHDKRSELEKYAVEKIKESSLDDDNILKHESRKPKSIVKRRPSKLEKRVSFSMSPPKVELFKKYEESDEGYDALELDESKKPDSRQNIWPPATTKSATEYSTKGENTSISKEKKPEYSLKIAKPIYKFMTPSSDEADATQQELFDFEDVIRDDPDTSEENTVTKHFAKNTIPEDGMDKLIAMEEKNKKTNTETKNDRITSTVGKQTSSTGLEKQNNEFRVGSAPLDIRPNPNILSYDGGPPQKTEKLQKEDEIDESSLFSSLNSYTNSSMVDPSRMSFTQRMEWEQFRKANRGVN